MAADRTLVNAAFKEATSRAGVDVPNLKPLYDSNTQNMKSYLGIATDAMTEYKVEKETLRIGKNAQLSEFKKNYFLTIISVTKLRSSRVSTPLIGFPS